MANFEVNRCLFSYLSYLSRFLFIIFLNISSYTFPLSTAKVIRVIDKPMMADMKKHLQKKEKNSILLLCFLQTKNKSIGRADVL